MTVRSSVAISDTWKRGGVVTRQIANLRPELDSAEVRPLPLPQGEAGKSKPKDGDGTCLENRRGVKTLVGSTPTSSAGAE